jgi:hypothetical protein
MRRVVIPSQAEPANWRLIFWNFTGHHDWVGRRLVPKVRRKAPPPKQIRDFRSREAAQEFADNLRIEYGVDEIAATILDLSAPPPPPRPQNQLLPGSWPYQSRAGAVPARRRRR